MRNYREEAIDNAVASQIEKLFDNLLSNSVMSDPPEISQTAKDAFERGYQLLNQAAIFALAVAQANK